MKNQNADQVQYGVLELGVDANNFLGVAAYQEGKEVDRIMDITVNRPALEKFLDLCNRSQLSLCHFREVMSDFISSETMVCWF